MIKEEKSVLKRHRKKLDNRLNLKSLEKDSTITRMTALQNY